VTAGFEYPIYIILVFPKEGFFIALESMDDEKQQEKMREEPAIGIPYAYPAKPMQTVTVPPPPQNYYFSMGNAHQAGIVPSNAIYGFPEGIPLRETLYRDTPAPFECPHCGKSGLTTVRLLNHQSTIFFFQFCEIYNLHWLCIYLREKFKFPFYSCPDLRFPFTSVVNSPATFKIF
jgi:hypothetical protein